MVSAKCSGKLKRTVINDAMIRKTGPLGFCVGVQDNWEGFHWHWETPFSNFDWASMQVAYEWNNEMILKYNIDLIRIDLPKDFIFAKIRKTQEKTGQDKMNQNDVR